MATPGGEIVVPRKPLMHGATVETTGFDEVLKYPAGQVRFYEGPVAVASNCLTFRGSSILPESYRHPFATNPNNPATLNIDREVARIQDRFVPDKHLAGRFFHLDASNSATSATS